MLPVGVAGNVALVLSLAEALVSLYQALPPGWDVIKVTPSRPLGKDGINPETGIAFIEDWGPHCQRGFVSSERFASSSTEAVIPRTNRNTSRKWRKLDKSKSGTLNL